MLRNSKHFFGKTSSTNRVLLLDNFNFLIDLFFDKESKINSNDVVLITFFENQKDLQFKSRFESDLDLEIIEAIH
jgi:hypothetical protein